MLVRRVPRRVVMLWGLAAGTALLLSMGAGAAAGATAQVSPGARGAGGPLQALVTQVAGSVVVLKGRAADRQVKLWDKLPQGTRLRLGKSSKIKLLWLQHGGSTTITGPRRAVTLSPGPAPRKAAPSPSVAANLWKALVSRLRYLGRPKVEQAQLGPGMHVRGPEEEWQKRPADEWLRPGDVTLTWREGAAGAAEYTVIVWGSGSAQPWMGTSHGHAVTVPSSAGLAPGQPYWWVVSPASGVEASPVNWFGVLDRSRAAALDQELQYTRELFAQADPPSVLHLFLGCVYASYGLASDAAAEYRSAGLTAKEYEALIGSREEPQVAPAAGAAQEGGDQPAR